MKRKVIAICILFVGIFMIHHIAYAGEITGTFKTEEKNPLYQDESIVLQKESKKLRTISKAADTHDAVNYEENKDKLALMIQENMINRNTEFTIYAKLVTTEPITQEIYNQYTSELLTKAVSEELAQNSSAGDYLRWSWSWYGISSSYTGKTSGFNHIYEFNLGFSLIYYTTKEQEDELESSIEQYIDKNIEGKDYSDLEKMTFIYYYICNNVTYDYANLEDESYKLKYTAYAAMQHHTAVCQGYSALYYKILKEAGVPNVRMIASIKSERHGWNIVKVGNWYYNVDCTWGSEPSYDLWAFFLKGSKTFTSLGGHTRGEDYTTESFKKQYPIDPEDYQDEKEKIDIASQCTLEKLSATYVYTGKEIKPKFNLCYGDACVLTPNRDYMVTYQDNVLAGIASIQVTGIGDYEGTITRTFQIIPSPIKGLKASNNTTNQVKLSWTKKTEATGYEIYQYDTKTKKDKKIQDVKTNTTTIKKLAAGTTYTWKVKAYKTISSGKLYGDTSSITTATLPNKVTITSLKKGSKKLTLKWKKIAASTGYVIQYSTSSRFTKSTTRTITITSNKTVSRVLKSLQKKKKYYVRVRAYKQLNGKKYYGAYSTVKTCKTK